MANCPVCVRLPRHKLGMFRISYFRTAAHTQIMICATCHIITLKVRFDTGILSFKLAVIQLRVKSILLQQAFMVPLLYDMSVTHDKDNVRLTDR